MQFAGYTNNIVCSYVESNSVRLVADDDNITSSAVSPTRREAHEKTYIWNAEPPVKRLCLPSSVDALARLPTKHNNGPRCPRPSTVPACSQLGDARAAST